jgi:hypothetical protein
MSLTKDRFKRKTANQNFYLAALLLISTFSLGLAGCSGLVSGNAGSTTPPPTSDTTPPTVLITSPAASATVSGNVNVTATATDNVSVAKVQFKVDGTNTGPSLPGAPYAYTWNTTTFSAGNHSITAVATDGAGNSTTSAAVSVKVDNTVPDTTPPTVSISAPANGSTVSGTVSVTANASDNVSVASVQFQLDGANVGGLDTASPFSYSWSSTTASNGSHTLRAIAKDSAGNSTTSAAVTVTVSNTTTDTTPPTVSISAPASGATVSGTVSVTANASDNVGVASVQFQLDGANLGSLDTASPFSTSWSTATASNGSHALRAIAKDAAGNSTASASVTVTVSNTTTDTTPPSVPTGLATTAASSTQINLSWTASTDNVGVTGYKIFRSGTQIGTSSSTTYQDGGRTPSTSYTYTVAANDAAGNTSAQSASASATTLASSGGGGIPTTLGWYQIPNTLMSAACPPAATYPDIQAGQGCPAVISSWGGGWADTTRNRLMIWGGGHADYWGNELYALNLAANPITLTRLNEPTRFTSNAENCQGGHEWDGKPCSRHSYDYIAYSPTADVMINFGGSLPPGGSFCAEDIWRLNSSALTWTSEGSGNWDCNSVYVGAAYDPNSQLIFFADDHNIFSYNTNTNVMTNVGGAYSERNSLALSSVVIDPVHKYLFVMGGSGGGGTGGNLYRFNISNPASVPAPTDLLASSTGCDAWTGSSSPQGPGVAWYPLQNKIVLWSGGNSVGLYDPVANSCTTVTYPGGPGAAQTHGTFGRFSYFPALGVFALVNDWAQNAWTLRIDPASGGTGGSGPAISSVTASSITTLGATVTWTTDVASTSQVEYGTSTSYGNLTTLDASLVTSHSVALSGLATNTLYHYRVHSKNAGGTESISGDSAFQTNNTADTTPPTVSITTPATNATLSGTVTLTASASDNVGVANVQFQLDGANLGSALTSAPYSMSWNTTTTTNAVYSLTAQARDAANNVGTSAAVPVTVSNSTSSADQNFQMRCASPGVLNCQGFDTSATFSQQVDFINMTDGFNPPGNPNNIRDTTIFLSGGSSAKFHIPANAGVNCCANWFAYFGQGAKNQHFNENSTFYVQYAFRADSTWTSTNWTSDAGSTWPKLSIFHSLLQGFGGVPGSCASMEITTVNIHVKDVLNMYTECGARQLETSSDGITYNENGAGPYGQQGWTEPPPFTGYQCAWNNGAWNVPNCFNFQANQWYTLYWKVSIGTWGSPNSTIEAWVAPYGQQMKKWINVHSFILTNDPPSNCNGLSPCPGFNILELTQFMTAHSGSNLPADVWYDELIISTQPIPAPGGQTP